MGVYFICKVLSRLKAWRLDILLWLIMVNWEQMQCKFTNLTVSNDLIYNQPVMLIQFWRTLSTQKLNFKTESNDSESDDDSVTALNDLTYMHTSIQVSVCLWIGLDRFAPYRFFLHAALNYNIIAKWFFVDYHQNLITLNWLTTWVKYDQ